MHRIYSYFYLTFKCVIKFIILVKKYDTITTENISNLKISIDETNLTNS